MRYREITEAKSKKLDTSTPQGFLRKASGFGYEFKKLPKHFWSNEEVRSFYIDDVYEVVYLKEGAYEEDYIGRAYDEEGIVEVIKRHAKNHEPDLLK